MGVSLVLHPRNPYAPTVHLNVRISPRMREAQGSDHAWWFGGAAASARPRCLVATQVQFVRLYVQVFEHVVKGQKTLHFAIQRRRRRCSMRTYMPKLNLIGPWTRSTAPRPSPRRPARPDSRGPTENGGVQVGRSFPGRKPAQPRVRPLARSTVRETLRALENQGLIRMVPNRGAFVNGFEAKSWALQVTQGFLEPSALARRRDHDRRGPLRVRAPADHVAKALNVAKSQDVFVLERVRQIDGKPAMHLMNWLPHDVGAALLGKPVLEGAGSRQRQFARVGILIYSARRQAEAVAAPEDVAKLLRLKMERPDPADPVGLPRRERPPVRLLLFLRSQRRRRHFCGCRSAERRFQQMTRGWRPEAQQQERARHCQGK